MISVQTVDARSAISLWAHLSVQVRPVVIGLLRRDCCTLALPQHQETCWPLAKLENSKRYLTDDAEWVDERWDAEVGDGQVYDENVAVRPQTLQNNNVHVPTLLTNSWHACVRVVVLTTNFMTFIVIRTIGCEIQAMSFLNTNLLICYIKVSVWNLAHM